MNFDPLNIPIHGQSILDQSTQQQYKKKSRAYIAYLDISGFFNGFDELKLKQNIMAPEMNAGYGTDNDVGEFHGGDEALAVGKRTFDEVGTELLEGEESLKLVDVETDLCSPENVGFVTLFQACHNYPLPYVPCTTNHQNLALTHLFFITFYLFVIFLGLGKCC